jgi:hypothetical protein
MLTSGMRTTINLDEDVLRVARSIASAEGKSMGEVISALVRKGLRSDGADGAQGMDGDFPIFEVSEDAPALTPEMVRDALEDIG